MRRIFLCSCGRCIPVIMTENERENNIIGKRKE
jgi:hypothetical protein